MPTSIDATLWENWKGAIRTGTRLTGIAEDVAQRRTDFTMVDDHDQEWSVPVRQQKLYALGLDIVGYSTRSMPGQLYLTSTFFVALDATRDLLRRIGWLGQNEPRAVLPTGDGALIVFEHLEQAFPFLMTQNMFVEDINRGPRGGVDPEVDREQPVAILPCEIRAVLATGNLIEIAIEGRTNFVGDALVKCARILNASKGAHFLVDEHVMGELLRLGGINETPRIGVEWGWGQRFHCAHLAPRKVKTGTFGFWNIFGQYDSRAVLVAAAEAATKGKRGSAAKTKHAASVAADSREYSIGSHDVTAIQE